MTNWPVTTGSLIMSQLVRVCVRRLPPDVTEKSFRELHPVREVLGLEGSELCFYSPEQIGETSAPLSAMAMVVLPAERAQAFYDGMKAVRFTLPFSNGGKAGCVVEWAPMYRPLGKAAPTGKVAEIDNDPDFVAFTKSFDMSYTPATDQAAAASEEPVYEDIPSAEEYWKRFTNTGGGGQGGNNQGQRGRKKGGKKRRGGRQDS